MTGRTHVVTCFLRNRGEVLLIRRSDAVGTYRGLWGGISGHAEGDPDVLARREIDEETGLLDATTLVRRGDPLSVSDSVLDREWVVHPYLYDCDSRDVEPNEEIDEVEWVAPTEIRRRETVPALWETYQRVAPSLESVAGDAAHGSAYVSIRALEVLRDEAGARASGNYADERAVDDWERLADVARSLRTARPSMVALANRVNRVMADAREERSAAAVEHAARSGIERAFRADEEAAANAAVRCRGAERVLTLSRSGTVLDALRDGSPESVVVLESRPACEGVEVAAELVDAGLDVSVTLDAAVAHAVATERPDLVLVGADAVLPDGSVVNKVGTRTIAVVAARHDVPVFAVAATAKIAPDVGRGDWNSEFNAFEPRAIEPDDPESVAAEGTGVAVTYPTFDRTPPALIEGVVTEEGTLDAAAVATIAEEHARDGEW